MPCTKIKRTIYFYINVHVRGRSYENYSTQKVIARSIFNLQFTAAGGMQEIWIPTAMEFLVHPPSKQLNALLHSSG